MSLTIIKKCIRGLQGKVENMINQFLFLGYLQMFTEGYFWVNSEEVRLHTAADFWVNQRKKEAAHQRETLQVSQF